MDIVLKNLRILLETGENHSSKNKRSKKKKAAGW